MRLEVFEFSNSHVLCEKQPSQPCRAIDLDQSEQVLAIINKYCGPVFCDRKFKLKNPNHNKGSAVTQCRRWSPGMDFPTLIYSATSDGIHNSVLALTFKLYNLTRVVERKSCNFLNLCPMLTYFLLNIYCKHLGLSSPFFSFRQRTFSFSRCHLHSFINPY